MVSLPPVGGLVTIRDKSNESGVVRELQELDGLMTGDAAVGVQGEEQRRKNTVLRGTGGLKDRDMFPQLHVLFPVGQEVCDSPAGGVRHTLLGELVLKKSRDDVVEGRAEVHKQDPGVGSCGVKVPDDEVEGHVDGVVYEGLHDHRGQGDRSVVVKSCDPCFFRDGDNGEGFKAGWYVASLQ